MQRILHTYDTHGEALQGFFAFACLHPEGAAHLPDKTVTRHGDEVHQFCKVVDETDRVRLGGTVWTSIDLQGVKLTPGMHEWLMTRIRPHDGLHKEK